MGGRVTKDRLGTFLMLYLWKLFVSVMNSRSMLRCLESQARVKNPNTPFTSTIFGLKGFDYLALVLKPNTLITPLIIIVIIICHSALPMTWTRLMYIKSMNKAMKRVIPGEPL